MNIHKKFSIFAMLLLLGALIFGCVPASAPTGGGLGPKGDNPCSIPRGHILSEVIQDAQKVLLQRECQTQFDAIFETILLAGEGDPKPGNKAIIGDFLEWCVSNGIFKREVARDYYGRYFSKNFMSMADGSHKTICNQCTNMPKLKSMLKTEMKQKKRGLLDICKDKEGFKNAYHIRRNGILVMEAACEACANY